MHNWKKHIGRIAMSELLLGPDGLARCAWHAAAPEFLDYHDREWGFPVGDDRRLFEKICLEGFQSGLSWRTILAKRDNFRAAFDGFDPARVAGYGEREIERLLADPGIIRNRRKILSVVNNARRALALIEHEGSLAAFLWRYAVAPGAALATTRATSPESVALSKALKQRGWSFVGPTTAYAFMQAMGLVNDHVEGCVTRIAVEQARAAFVRPGS
jgi:DNA-3-methyladenine glycosylase I